MYRCLKILEEKALRKNITDKCFFLSPLRYDLYNKRKKIMLLIYSDENIIRFSDVV